MNASMLLPVLVLAAALGTALVGPLYTLLVGDLLLGAWPAQWDVGGVLLDPTDVLLGALVTGLLLRGRRTRPIAVPYLRLWLLLGLLLSAAYLLTPLSREYLTDPVRIVYQLYRYCWKPILLFPLAALLLCRRDRLPTVLLVLVAVGDLCALQGIPEGYAGLRAHSPFDSANSLGAALVVPILAALALALLRPSRRIWLFSLASLPVLLRAFLFTGSRGAFAAVMVGVSLMLVLLVRTPASRPRVARFALAAAAVLLLLVVVVKPGLSQRPNVQRLLSLSEGTEASTFRWRIEERWPHFWRIAVAHPWFGTGTEVDPSLGERANTPHNGYLAIAVWSGFPALAVYLAFAFTALANSIRMRRLWRDPELRAFAAVNASALLAILVHNIVDSVILMPFVAKLFWMHTAFAAMAVRQPELFLAPERPVATAEGGSLGLAGAAPIR